MKQTSSTMKFEIFDELIEYCGKSKLSEVWIIDSNNAWYVEADVPFVRTWETLLFHGKPNDYAQNACTGCGRVDAIDGTDYRCMHCGEQN